MRGFLALSLCALSVLASPALAATPTSVKATAPSWFLKETTNFRIYCSSCAADADQLAQRCEDLRQKLSRVWLGPQATANWAKRCDVVVFPDQQSYLQVVGAEAVNTAGSALIDTNGTQISARRIDLRGDLGAEMHSALAHELTHVIIADRIDRSRIPAWADEGMAVLADTPEKQALHLADFRAGIQADSAFRTSELMAMNDYPHPERMGIFYGQSVSLVNYLVRRESPAKFLQFVELSIRNGYDTALRKVYQIESVAQLESLWRKSLNSGEISFASYAPREIWAVKALKTNEG